jgi:ubiquinone/menaquinone biosynthesis C-methylase UbiE
MGLYADHIVPCLMDWFMGRARFQEQRKLALAGAHGHVLEVGFGTGLNVPPCRPAVKWLTAVEPGTCLLKKVQLRTTVAAIPIELMRIRAERLPYDNAKFDCGVSTWTLCTIPDVRAALQEVRRVLGARNSRRSTAAACGRPQQGRAPGRRPP